jgi:hypothetical protein
LACSKFFSNLSLRKSAITEFLQFRFFHIMYITPKSYI